MSILVHVSDSGCSVSFHRIIGVRLTPTRQHPAKDGQPAFAVRDLFIRFEGGGEQIVPLYANGIDAAAALALSGPELDALCGPPALPDRLIEAGPCNYCGAGESDLCLCERFAPAPDRYSPPPF